MEYIEQLLSIKIKRRKFNYASKLPIFLTNIYAFSSVTLGNHTCVFIKPKEKLGHTSSIKKHIAMIQQLTEAVVVLELASITNYRRQALITNRIPFVVPGKQLYLPFLDVALSEKLQAVHSRSNDLGNDYKTYIEKTMKSEDKLIKMLLDSDED